MGKGRGIVSVYRVKKYPPELFVMGVLGFLGIATLVSISPAWAAFPNWPWQGWSLLISGIFLLLLSAAFISWQLLKGPKEIEVGPEEIIIRYRGGKKITCQKIDKITVGMLHFGRWRGRPARAVPCWIEITGQKPEGGIRTININKSYAKAEARVGRKELVSLKDDLQRCFGSKVEEKKVRFA